MKRISKALSLTLATMLMVSVVLAGCTKKETSTASPSAVATAVATAAATAAPEATPTPVPQLEKVKLVAYLLGEAPPDGPAVMAEVNKKLEADINATIELKYIPFGDIATKYPLILSSGEDFDIIFGSVNYADNAGKGGYHEITMADVEKNMPLTFKATSPEQWADTLIKGKIYMIPQTFKELNIGGQFYREDLRKKYNVPEMKTTDDLEAYFEAIKKNEKDMLPADGSVADMEALLTKGYTNFGSGITFFDLDDPTYKVTSIFDPEYQAVLKKNAETMKRFNEKGYIPKNPFAQKSMARDLAKSGKSAVWGNAFENYPQYASDAKAKGQEIGIIPGLSNKGIGSLRPATGNGFSFSPNSKNYERALMAIDRIHQDPSYNMLVSFGIEGKNYVMKDGKLALAPGIDAAKNPYPMYGAGWWSNNRDQWPPLESYTQEYIDLKKKLQEVSKSNLLLGFNFNTESVKTELANVTNVKTQYGDPISVGLIKGDVDAAIKQYMDKLKTAGAEKVIDEVKKQVAQFVADHTAQ
jgi:putative aldouronate transport system substrate-binding protein